MLPCGFCQRRLAESCVLFKAQSGSDDDDDDRLEVCVVELDEPPAGQL